MRTFAAACVWLLTGMTAEALDLQVQQSNSVPAGSPVLIHQGTFTTNGNLLSDACVAREQKAEVKFDPAFASTPTVTVALTGLDVDHTRNTRVTMRAEGVSKDSMILIVGTWCETNLYSAVGSFIAVGVAAQSLR